MDFLEEIKLKKYKVDIKRVQALLNMPELFETEYMIIDESKDLNFLKMKTMEKGNSMFNDVRIYPKSNCSCFQFQSLKICTHLTFVYYKLFEIEAPFKIILMISRPTELDIFETFKRKREKYMPANLSILEKKHAHLKRIGKMTKEMKEIHVNKQCHICLQKLDVVKEFMLTRTNCEHVFHTVCFRICMRYQ